MTPSVCILREVNISSIFCFIFRDLLTFSSLINIIFEQFCSLWCNFWTVLFIMMQFLNNSVHYVAIFEQFCSFCCNVQSLNSGTRYHDPRQKFPTRHFLESWKLAFIRGASQLGYLKFSCCTEKWSTFKESSFDSSPKFR